MTFEIIVDIFLILLLAGLVMVLLIISKRD